MMATVGDVAAWATIVVAVLSTTISLAGLVFVIVQLRGTNAAARAQATIAFQAAFKESRTARSRLMQGFPIHTSLLSLPLSFGENDNYTVWTKVNDLTDEQKNDAHAVINALNDVAQYVSDGLSLRSALQQYHTVFIRAGFLLAPFIKKLNAPHDDRLPARIGVRVIDLYNAGLGYHSCNPKHRGHELTLTRPAADGSKQVSLLLLDRNGNGVQPLPGYGVDGERDPTVHATVPKSVAEVVKKAEHELRPQGSWRLF